MNIVSKIRQIKRVHQHPENPTITNQYIIKTLSYQVGGKYMTPPVIIHFKLLKFTTAVCSTKIQQTCSELTNWFHQKVKHCWEQI